MDETLKVGLQEELIAELTTELSKDPAFDAELLKAKVIGAIREVKRRRNYSATSYNNQQIQEDLYDFYSVIRDVSLYDYNTIGAQGQKSHNENSVSRSWVDREDLFKSVFAFVKVI